jgi:hypothetical protein
LLQDAGERSEAAAWGVEDFRSGRESERWDGFQEVCWMMVRLEFMLSTSLRGSYNPQSYPTAA